MNGKSRENLFNWRVIKPLLAAIASVAVMAGSASMNSVAYGAALVSWQVMGKTNISSKLATVIGTGVQSYFSYEALQGIQPGSSQSTQLDSLQSTQQEKQLYALQPSQPDSTQPMQPDSPQPTQQDTQPDSPQPTQQSTQPDSQQSDSSQPTQPDSSQSTHPDSTQQDVSIHLGDDEETGGMPSLTIEDSGRYEGMGRSYYNGYLPSASGGYAVIVLPLVADGEISDNRITVTPQLGTTDRSPFVYRNYQRTFEETEVVPLDGGEAERLYLVHIELELSKDRYNGIYPVTLTVAGQSAAGIAFSQIFTSYVTIKDGKSTESVIEEPVVEEPTKPESQPLLYISSYTVTPQIPVAGQPFVMKASVRNTSPTRPVRNMAIRVSCDSPELTLQEESATVYWDRLEADSTRELTLHFKVENGISVGKYNVILDMSFDNEEAVTLSASGSVPVIVTQPMELEASFPDLASRVNAGDTVSLAFQALNLGKSRAYNVRFELDAAGLVPNGLAYIGNLEAGSSGNADMKVFVGSKDMNRSLDKDAERYGSTSGLITMIYEDENGNEFKEEHPFNTYIEELVIRGVAEEEPHESGSGQWFIATGVGIAAAAGLTGWLIYHSRARKLSGNSRTKLSWKYRIKEEV